MHDLVSSVDPQCVGRLSIRLNLFTGPAEHIRATDAADDPAAGGGTGPGQLG